ncbi:MAG TPA: DnaB-like helicase N-terminal domain-containing protein, partial [Anaerolineales bacterium]|nr:DnaB-like helicase N-terminal domain-containing protein [Anaerolineales bacterium]
MTTEKLKNIQTEQAALSCVLIDPNTWAEMAIKPEHFQDTRHVIIAKTLEDMFKRGAEIDLITISNELNKNDLLG